jgi:hypothetical protein
MLSLLLARTGPPAMPDLSPLSGAERKLDFGDARAVVDPKQTSGLARAAFCHGSFLIK